MVGAEEVSVPAAGNVQAGGVMNASNQHTDFTIVGGGPVGLYLAGILLQKNFSVTVLEQKKSIDKHSKSLGIHPVSLELFDEAGIVTSFLENGLKIREGIAFLDDKKTGSVTFENCPKPYNYILALPQHQTEAILEKWVNNLSPETLIRRATVRDIHQKEDRILIDYEKSENVEAVSSSYMIGCDGKNSFVRKAADIKFPGKTYPDTYIMGDYSDNTDFGTRAAVYLHRAGLIESFPLPSSMRRWVVKTDRYIEHPDRELLDQLVFDRIGHTLGEEANVMLSSFGVQHHLAESFYSNRIVLAGDSAHIVSPIGGQGMNLGWLTAYQLAEALEKCLVQPGKSEQHLQGFSRQSRKIAKTVARRAEVNMWLGRRRRFPIFRNSIANLIVNTPLQNKMAKLFTMRGLVD